MIVPLIGIKRLCMETDGHGITTLVAFHGCPLRCKYCLNPNCLKDNGVKMHLSIEEIMSIVKRDELYYIATNGGLTFGGGEPLLNYTAINSIMELGASRWHTTVETSLNVPQTFLESIVSYIDEFIVDIKDMNPIIYKSYTGKNNNKVIRNLRWLVNQGKSDRITVRVPLIENFNTNEDRKHSCLELKKMGLTRFDLFKYITNIYD